MEKSINIKVDQRDLQMLLFSLQKRYAVWEDDIHTQYERGDYPTAKQSARIAQEYYDLIKRLEKLQENAGL